VRRAPNAIAAGWVIIGLGLGFLVTTAVRNQPADTPLVRGPVQTRLAALIRVEQDRSDQLRREAEDLRARVRAIQLSGARQQLAVTRLALDVQTARRVAGMVAVTGPALVVSLSDSTAEESPTNNLNDLVIHSQDVQAVANGLWSAGAEAIAVDGERVIPTSAILCVGNTLLINGTVHSPPYRFVAVGDPDELRRRFFSDSLVQRLRSDADRFGLGFSVSSLDSATVPAYTGSSSLKFARRV